MLHRRHPRPARAHPETADVAGPAHADRDDAENTPDRVVPPASLDQVLRRAAEAREAQRDPDD